MFVFTILTLFPDTAQLWGVARNGFNYFLKVVTIT